MLTLDFIEGIKINDLDALDAAGIDRHRLAKNGASLVLRMIFDDGFFHADPHPGNLFIQPSARIALIDFGTVGEVGQEQRDHLADFLVAFTAGDPQALASSLLELSVTKDVVDREGLEAALSVFVSSYQARPLGEIAFGELLLELLTLLRTHHLQLPGEMAQLFKVLLMAEGMAVGIDPAFEMSEMLKPFAERIVAKRYSVAGLTKRFANSVTDLADLLAKLPRGVRRAVDILDRSGFEVHLRAAELEPLVGRAERAGNRLIAGLLAAAVVNAIGGSIARDRLPGAVRVPLVGVGLGAVATLSGYLLWTGRRHR